MRNSRALTICIETYKKRTLLEVSRKLYAETMAQSARGFAIVDAITPKLANVLHVSVLITSKEPFKYEILLSGIWEIELSDPKGLEDLLHGRIPVGTQDGIAFIRKALGHAVDSSALSRFVSKSLDEQQNLQAQWQEYKDEEPKKRAKLVLPKWPQWPSEIEDTTPIQVLLDLGKLPYPKTTPEDTRTIIAFGKLVYLMLENWMTIEEERLRRKYLKKEDKTPRLWPPNFN